MYKFYLLFFFIWIFFPCCKKQNSLGDKRDELFIENLNSELAYFFAENQFDSILIKSELLIDYGIRLNDTNIIVQGLYTKSSAFFEKKSSLELAGNTLSLANPYINSVSDTLLLFNSYRLFGIINLEQKKFEESLKYLELAFQLINGSKYHYLFPMVWMDKTAVSFQLYGAEYFNKDLVYSFEEILSNNLSPHDRIYLFANFSGLLIEIDPNRSLDYINQALLLQEKYFSKDYATVLQKIKILTSIGLFTEAELELDLLFDDETIRQRKGLFTTVLKEKVKNLIHLGTCEQAFSFLEKEIFYSNFNYDDFEDIEKAFQDSKICNNSIDGKIEKLKIYFSNFESAINDKANSEISLVRKQFENLKLENGLVISELETANQKERKKLWLIISLLLSTSLCIVGFSFIKYQKLTRDKLIAYNRLFDDYQAKKIGASSLGNPIVEEIGIYLKKEQKFLNNNFSKEEFFEQFNFTQESFKTFLVETNIASSFIDLINRYKIEYAIELFENPEYHHYTIEAIAEFVGFRNRQSFYNYFEKHTGIKPAFYRNKLMGKIKVT